MNPAGKDLQTCPALIFIMGKDLGRCLRPALSAVSAMQDAAAIANGSRSSEIWS
ncbi:hypothetical protein J7E50_02895 [Pedobacter sp. ISL-68]|uniref:hypothetical protein n=1 Tax=unclassified Pedobacter TaxID=2628915 RepID=UPI001BED1BBD|nr:MULTISPECIES: hypothetical protein [unclassified Pedobacter]MBT2560168.1 hypothetical protein [Pedobacter sp. ISL-64]MBT2589147.1 hypothetical protein [Pedobacter sp. ISL-68]